MKKVQDNVVQMYKEGLPLTEIGRRVGMTPRNVKRDLVQSNVYLEKKTISEKYEEAKKRYLDGESIKKISKEMNVSHDYLSKHLLLDGVKIRGKSSTKKIITETESKEIMKLYNSGESIRNISNVLKINRHNISFHLKENGIIPKKYSQKSEYHTDVFSSIDTEEKAYWLGMLYADGYVAEVEHRVFLKLKESDKSHVQAFADFCGNNVSVIQECFTGYNKEKRIAWKAQVMSKKIKMDLIDKGCIPRKTKALRFPNESIVPEQLIRHFIRGYFDGDGCISIDMYQVRKRKSRNGDLAFSIVGNEDFIKGCEKILKTGNKICEQGSIFSLSVKGNKKAMRIFDWMYKDANVYLERKHKLYKEHKSRLCRLEEKSLRL